MAITLTAMKCPNCNADIDVVPGKSEMFCTYCGTKILLSNENEVVVRHVDEAALRQTDLEMKKLEIQQTEKKASEELKKKKILATIIGAVLCVLFIKIGGNFFSTLGSLIFIAIILLWVLGRNKKEASSAGTRSQEYSVPKVRVPTSIANCQSKNYATVEQILIGAGFTNVQSIPMNDLTVGLLKKPGMVESVSINGHNVTTGGFRYPANAPVIISYHSIARKY